MNKLSGSILFLLTTIFLAPALTLLAQGSYGGVYVKDEALGMEFTDPFKTQEERDNFGAFFNTTLPSDVSLEWGSEALDDEKVLRTDADTSNDLVLTWNSLPEPLSGCGGYSVCVDGLMVEIYKRTNDVFEAVWYGEYGASGAWGGLHPHTGMYYASMDSQTFSFNEEGEYYVYIHRPKGVFVNKKEHTEKKYVDILREILLPVAYAYDASKYSASVVGGIIVTVTHQVEGETTLTLPTEGRYEGERGVVAPGPHPERGYPDDEVFTFKVVYTSSDNTAPESVEVRVAGKVLPMTTDESAVDSVLRDGDYTNGEQYLATSTIPKGMYVYEFHSTVNGEAYELITKTDSAELLTCTAGYSSVAFVPGIQSSRLFKKGLVFENQLWEPNIDGDARKLALNEDGTPTNDGIYTKTGPDGVIDEALGITTNIYKSFLDDLDDWKNDEHLISDYAVLPYDWRYSYETILGSGIVDEDEKLEYGPDFATDTPYMYERLESLVDESASGRIFLIGHSMGGLLIKKMLADMEDDENHPYRHLLGRVDNIALVATPQLGTPKAVASLLHGIEQGYFIAYYYPLFTKETARILGNGLPSAYTLLPSKMYFDRVKDVNLEGEEGSYTELIINGDCSTAKDYEGMLECFDSADSDAQKDDLITPLQPRSEYVEYADELHDRLDDWTPPDMDDDGSPDFTVTQIAGWGLSTISAIEYKEKERQTECPPDLTGTCMETYKDPQPRYTMDGDRTVVVPSAVAMPEGDMTNNLYFDVYKYNKGPVVERKHSNILEIEPLREVLKNITENKTATTNNPEHFYTDSSELEYPDAYMRLSLHSPVDIEVQSGEYRIGKRELSDGGVYFDASIPNSYYDELGEGKYVGFPVNGKARTIHLTGTGTGTFTFVLTLIEDGKETQTKTYSDVPVTPTTRTTLTTTTFDDIEVLPLDTNGDGSTDISVYPDETQKEVTYDDLIDALQNLTVPYKKSLVRKAVLASWFDEKGKERHAKWVLRILERSVTRLSSNWIPRRWKISEESAESILEAISNIRDKYER